MPATIMTLSTFLVYTETRTNFLVVFSLKGFGFVIERVRRGRCTRSSAASIWEGAYAPNALRRTGKRWAIEVLSGVSLSPTSCRGGGSEDSAHVGSIGLHWSHWPDRLVNRGGKWHFSNENRLVWAGVIDQVAAARVLHGRGLRPCEMWRFDIWRLWSRGKGPGAQKAPGNGSVLAWMHGGLRSCGEPHTYDCSLQGHLTRKK